jgi:hypothetical protein
MIFNVKLITGIIVFQHDVKPRTKGEVSRIERNNNEQFGIFRKNLIKLFNQ